MFIKKIKRERNGANRVEMNPFKNLKLTREERDIEEAIERGEFVPSRDSEHMKKLFQEAAKAHIALRKSKRITLSVNYEDLLRVKAKAKQRRIPYQTLLAAVIHQYADDNTRVTLSSKVGRRLETITQNSFQKSRHPVIPCPEGDPLGLDTESIPDRVRDRL